MYYLGLGGGSLTGGRFLAPNAAENKGTFTEQLTHKNYTEEELVTLYTDAGLYTELRDEDNNLVAIDVYPQEVYADADQKIKLGTLVKRFNVTAFRTVAVEEVQHAALVYLANGTIDEGSKYFYTEDVLYPTNAYESSDSTHLINNGTYQYKYFDQDTDREELIGTGTVGGLLVETGKRDSSRVTYDTFKYDLNGDRDYDDAGETVEGPTLSWYADSKATLSHGAQATTLAENTDYIVCNANHAGSSEADHDGQLYLSAGSFKFVEYVGQAYDKTTIKGTNTTVAAVTGIVERGAYQTADAIYATVNGVETKFEAKDLFTTAYDKMDRDAVQASLAGSSVGSPATLVINPIDSTNKISVHVGTSSDLGTLVYAYDEDIHSGWDVEDSAHNKYVYATSAMITNPTTGYAGSKPKTIQYISKINGRYVTVDKVPTIYDTAAATREVWGLDILVEKSGEQLNADGVYYAKINGENIAVYETGDYVPGSVDNTNNLDSYEADYYDEHMWDDGAFAAAFDDAKAADATHVMITDQFGEVQFIPASNLYAVGTEGTRKVSPIANLLKSDKIVVINVDDEENPYRLASITPVTYTANDAAGYYLWNEETSTFDFQPKEIVVNSYAKLVGNASTKFGKTTNIESATITSTDFEKVFNASFEIEHLKGIYYLETPANESDLYVLYTGDTSDLDIDYSVNTAKGEAYVEVAGKTVTTKAAQLEDRGWYPAFETEEELVKFVYAITGLDTALVGDKDTKDSTFKAWYDAAVADLEAEIGSLPTGEVLPTTAIQPDHKKKACEYNVSSTVDGSKVTISSNASEINTSEAGVYDLVWTASYEGEALEDTHTVKVVVAPNYTRTWENGKVKTLVSYYVNNPTAKYAEYNYDWANKTATVTYYNVDGSVNDTATISL